MALTCPQCGWANRDNVRFCSKCRFEFQIVSFSSGSKPVAVGALLQGRYRIDRQLGQGGFGAVYSALDTRLKRPCVVKQMMIPPGAPQAEVDELTLTFEREAESLVSLNQPGHPNIPEIYDFFSDANGNFLVMKQIEGENLERRAARAGGRLPLQDVLALMVQVADALVYLHSKHPNPVMHRDVKPQNVVVDPTGRAFLVDFGLTKMAPSAAPARPGAPAPQGVVLSSARGTPGFAAPEQYKAGGAVPQSDVYALAATIYHLVTGDDPSDHPFQFPMLNTLSQDLRVIVEPALATDPAQRPTSLALKTQLEHLANPAGGPSFRWQDGTISRRPEDISALVASRWTEARGYFTGAQWEKWFTELLRNDVLAHMARAKAQHKDPDMALDAFVRALDPTFPPARLQASTNYLDAGSVPWQETRKMNLEVRNAGSGCLHGRVVCNAPWVQVSQADFTTPTRQTLQVTVNTSGLRPQSQPYTAQLTLDADASGVAQVGVVLRVPEPMLAFDARTLDLGAAHRGEALQGQFEITNSGGSACSAEITVDRSWLTASPARVNCAPGSRSQVTVEARTGAMKIGRHMGQVQVRAEAGGWTQSIAAQVMVSLPWFKTFWHRWAVTLDWAAVGMLLALAWFGFARPDLLSLNLGLEPVSLGRSSVDPMTVALLVLASGWLGVLVLRGDRPDYPFEGCIGMLLVPVLPWAFNPLSALMGTAVAVTGVMLALKADVWLGGLLASLALCGLVGAVAAGLLHRPAKTKRRPWSGLFGTALLTAAAVGSIYLAVEPRFGWRLAETVVMPTPGSSVTQWAFAPGGATLAAGSSGNSVWLWRVSDEVFMPKLAGQQSYVRSVAIAADGTMLASGSDDRMVRLWRTSDGALLRTLAGQAGAITSVVFAPDGMTLASASDDRTVQLWQVSDGASLRTLSGHDSGVSSIAFSPDGAMLASVSSTTVWLWQVADGALLRKLDVRSSINSVAFAPDGAILATASYGPVQLWRVSDGATLQMLKGGSYSSEDITFAPDGAMLAASSPDGVVWLWRLADGKLLRTLVGHTDSVHSVVFSPDDGRLASVSRDGTVKLWRVGN